MGQQAQMFTPFLLQLNEAFASQYVYCIQELGLDPDKVNVNGGAIAFGHPLDKSLIFRVHHIPD